MDISIAFCHFELNFSVCIHKVLLEGSMSQNFDLGLSFFFNVKKRVTFDPFLIFKFLHFIKSKLGRKSKF